MATTGPDGGKAVRFATAAVACQVVSAALAGWTSAGGAEARSSLGRQSNSDAGVASFDCARAASARERAICADPALAALDGRLGRLYRERRARLSPEGARLLQDSERSWLGFVGIVCSPSDPEARARPNRRSCLMRQYSDRMEQLQKAGERIGPYLFNRVDLYAAQPSGDETGSVRGFYVQHAAYPQIDNADAPELRAWNRENVRALPQDGDCGAGDYHVDYEVGFANARLVSTEWRYSTYCHGTAHGFGGPQSSNTVLSDPLRPLRPDDLFGSGEGWSPILKARFWAALTRSGWRPPEDQPDVRQELEADFVRPNRWLLTRDGLQVGFGS